MKVKIKKWSTVASWYWDVKEWEQCGICRSAFESCCANCNTPGDDCPIGKQINQLFIKICSFFSALKFSQSNLANLD